MTSAAPQGKAFDRYRPGLYLICAAAAFELSVSVLIPQTYLRAAIVFPIALLLPGYAVLLLAFGPHKRLDWVPALSLSALLSMAFYPLAGLLLAAASIAPSTRSMVVAVDVLVAVALAVSFLRSRRLRTSMWNTSWVPAEPPRAEQERGLDGKRMLVLVAATLALGGLGLGVARHFEPKPVPQPYTAFYLTGAWSHPPTPVAARGGTPVNPLFSVTNRTHRPQTYQITPEVDGSMAWPSRTVTLSPGATWTGPLQGAMPADLGLHELIVKLTMQPQGTAVGSLTLWLQTTLG